jgi:hypothetical protein
VSPADELSDGLLDPVIERGHIYVSVAGESRFT